MGRPKHSLTLGHETFLERLVRVVESQCSPVIIAVGRNAPDMTFGQTDIRLVRDEVDFEGPLVALGRVLGQLPKGIDAVFACGCDTPLLEPAVIALLVNQLGRNQIATAEIGGRLSPLPGAYRTQLAAKIDRLVAAGSRRLKDLIGQSDTQVVGEADLRAADPELRSFWNVNEPADYERLRSIASLQF